MARPLQHSELIHFRAPEGTVAAVSERLKTGETLSDLWRRMVREWLAKAPMVTDK